MNSTERFDPIRADQHRDSDESSNSTDRPHPDTTGERPQASSDQSGLYSAILTSAAAQSTDLSDFVARIAAILVSEFSVDLVAVSHPHWDAPMMDVSRSTLADRLDGRFVRALLKSATTSATACDVPLRSRSSATTGEPPVVDPDNRTRGLHVRLADSNVNCAVLLVYDVHQFPDTATQINELKRLSDFADCCRIALDQLSTETGHGHVRHNAGSKNRRQALRHFHHDLSIRGTAYRIASESRRLLAVDRVSVLTVRRGRFRVDSVSGVAVVDRRANAIAAAEAFSKRVITMRRSVTLPSEDLLPPQITQALDHYLDETDVAAVTVIPLFAPSRDTRRSADMNSLSATRSTEDESGQREPIGVLLLESFSGDHPPDITPTMQDVGAEAAIALANACEHQRVFGLRFLKAMGDLFGGRRLPYSAIAVILASALLIAGSVIQVDHKIIASGFAEPAMQQNLFARTDGIVKEILVRDGQRVASGDVLLRLENADLETSAETLAGEIQTTSRRLASIQSMLLDPETDGNQSGRMAIEQRQLQSDLANLHRQFDLVQQQIAELELTAPIDGTVAAWQLKRRLSDRPVARGNHLLTLVRDEGPWQLRLEIADEDAAEVIRARAGGSDLQIEFAAASHPESTFAATLDRIATAARRGQDGMTVIDAEATIDSAELRPNGDVDSSSRLQSFASVDAHAGVEVTAKITCGRRSLLGSWFGDVADFVNRNVLFYVR